MDKEKAMKILKDFYDKSALFSIRTALDTVIPEIKESKDEKIRKEIIEYIKIGTYRKDWIAWLEKQGQTFTKKDVEKYLKYKEDKFIEKAVEWIKEKWDDNYTMPIIIDSVINDFKNYMKGE